MLNPPGARRGSGEGSVPYRRVRGFASPVSGGPGGPRSTGGLGRIRARIATIRLATDLCMAYQAARGTIPAIRVVATMMKDESKILSCFGGAATFETIVMHEPGHVLGPGHGADPTSVMDATLGAGTGNRNLTTADRDVPDRDGGGPAGLHARVPLPVPPPTAPTAPALPSLNQDVGLMAWDLAVADLSWTGFSRTQRERT